MTRLPVLFVSCNARSLEARRQAGSGPARMVWRQDIRSVLLISTDTDLSAPLVTHHKGNKGRSENIVSLLSARGFRPAFESEQTQARDRLLATLLAGQPEDLCELRLNTGMSEAEYRQVGLCLETMRDQGVLVMFLDDRAEGEISFYGRHLRQMLNVWVQDQQWRAAMSVKGSSMDRSGSPKLEDPTVCLLNAAFTLGGSKFPQRLFSSGMNCAGQMLAGFGWMR